MGKKRKKVGRAALLCLFWIVWREKNRAPFDNAVFSEHRLKSSLICNLRGWSTVHSGALTADRSLLEFLTFWGIDDFLGWWVFLNSLAPFFFFSLKYTPSILLGGFGCSLFLWLIHAVCLPIKKKKIIHIFFTVKNGYMD